MVIGCQVVTIMSLGSNAQKEGKVKGADASVPPREVEVPEELICKLCKELFKDAVVIPCCGDSFCDECKYGVSE